MKKSSKIISVFIILSVIISIFAGCTAAEKTFSKDGLSITLTEDFIEQEIEPFTATYATSKYFVSTLKEDFSVFEQAEISTDISENEYAKIVMENNKIEGEPKETDGIITFSYENDDSGEAFSYLTTVKKGTNAFWVIQLACKSDIYEENKEQLLTWAKTITVE